MRWMMALFVAIFSILAAIRWQIWSYGADTGIFTQAISAASIGFLDGPEAGSHFRFHWSPIIALMTPFVLLLRTTLTVQLVQVMLIAATAIPVYALVKRYSDDDLARKAVMITLLYAPLFSIAFEEFHELAFYPVLAIALIDAADRRAWRSFSAIALALLLIREDVLLLMSATGMLFMWIGFGRLKPILGANLSGSRPVGLAGIALVLASAMTMFGYFSFIIPHVGNWKPSHFYNYPFANGPLALMIALIKNPFLLAQFCTLGRGGYLLEAFLPLLLLPLRSVWFLPGVPGLLLILLASPGFVWRMGDHYAALWIPWTLLATFDLLISFHTQGQQAKAQAYYRGILAALVLVLIAFNPTHLGHYLKAAPERENALRALAIVPHDAHVLLHDEWYSHVALDYPNATVYPYTYYDWAVIDEAYDKQEVRNLWLPQLATQKRNGRLQAVARYGDVVVYHRVTGR